MTLPLKGAFDALTATEYNELIRRAYPLVARKTADDPYSTTSPLRNDPDLQVPIEVNSFYDVSLWIAAGVGTGVDFNLGFVFPGTVSGWWTFRNQTTAGALETVWQNTSAWSGTLSMEGSASDKAYQVFGVLATGSTAGQFQVRWGPLAAGTVTLRANSRLHLRKH